MPALLDQTIGMRLSRVDRALLRYMNRRLSRFGITTEQWAVLSQLAEQEGLNQKQLACRTEKDPATLLHILDILERKELLERRASPRDRRSLQLYISARGKQLCEEVSKYTESCFAEIVQGISRTELEATAAVLTRLRQNLDMLLRKENKPTSESNLPL